MASFHGLGLGLSIVFGCLLLAFVAEAYYLFWWKKRGGSRRSEVEEVQDDYGKSAKELLQLIFWKKSSSLHRDAPSSDSISSNAQASAGEVGDDGNGQDPEMGNNGKELLLKPSGEESVESELMRLHNLAGPPRFLFTINEETKEDLESDDGKSRGDRSRKGSRTRSLSDVILAIDTPFLTPLASPHNGQGFSFNPLFESSAEMELGWIGSSPPPKFKFLRDAEEKLYRRLKEDATRRALELSGSVDPSEEKEAGQQVVAIIVGMNGAEGKIRNLPQFPPSSSQVLPLASSPSTTAFRPLDKKLVAH